MDGDLVTIRVGLFTLKNRLSRLVIEGRGFVCIKNISSMSHDLHQKHRHTLIYFKISF